MGSSSWIQQLDYETLPFRCPRNLSSSLADPGPPRADKGKAPMSNGPVDSEGFTQVKSRNKGKGKKKTWVDRQNEVSINRFEALGDLVQEEGIPVELSSEVTGQHETQAEDVQKEDHMVPLGDLQVGQLAMDVAPQVQDIGNLPGTQGLKASVLVATDSPSLKETSASVKGIKASPILGI